jgi:hypothetical protein
MLDLVRHAVAQIPRWVYFIVAGLYMIVAGVWSFPHTRERLERESQDWVEKYASLYPNKEWAERHVRLYRSPFNQFLHQTFSVLVVIVGVCVVLLGILIIIT